MGTTYRWVCLSLFPFHFHNTPGNSAPVCVSRQSYCVCVRSIVLCVCPVIYKQSGGVAEREKETSLGRWGKVLRQRESLIVFTTMKDINRLSRPHDASSGFPTMPFTYSLILSYVCMLHYQSQTKDLINCVSENCVSESEPDMCTVSAHPSANTPPTL